MRTLRYLLPSALLTVLFLAAGCGKEEDGPSATDVQFEVPATMDIDYEASEISFRVQFSKPPLQSDQIVLAASGNASYTCAITSVTDKRFYVDISHLWSGQLASGSYNVYHQRGTARTLKGTTQMTIRYSQSGTEITPAEGSTVYGQVACGGKGVPGVVVSDGIEVVKTDADGVYQLASGKKHGYVFMSVPSGYEPLQEGILPKFHTQLSKSAGVAERVDFLLKEAPGQENHTVLLFGDMHLARRTNDQAQFRTFVSDVNSYVSSHTGKIYGLTLGDMTWDLYWITNNYSYKEYLTDANGIKDLAVWHTIGNHDHSMYYMGDFDTVKEYKELIAPTYYSFNIGGVHYVVLDDVECTNSTPTTDSNGNACYERTYNANLVQEQLAWLRKDLAEVPASTPLVVTMHIQLYNNSGTTRLSNASAPAFINILKPYTQVQLFTAHTHTVYNHNHLAADHLYEHNAGAVCGTWWWSAYETPGVHIGQDGSPAGYTILDVKGTDFQWQYKATGSDTGYQFRTYDRNQILLTAADYVPDGGATYQADFKPGIWGTASSANEVYINVWNYDPSWTIEVTEGGKALTATQVTVLDPLHLVAYTAKRLNKKAKATFATESNYHTFKVTASGPATTLDIRVTDRFGNTYTETMTRPKSFTTDIYKK